MNYEETERPFVHFTRKPMSLGKKVAIVVLLLTALVIIVTINK